MASSRDSEIKNDENASIWPPTTTEKKKFKKRPWSDAEFLRQLRVERERVNYGHRMEHFFGTPLNLKADLPLPEYEDKDGFGYQYYRVEQLQDFCNKTTVIYGTDSNTWGIPLYEYIFDIWSHGDIHTTDIEFGRLFAKFMEASRSDSKTPSTQDVLKLHSTLLGAVDAAKAGGFVKYSPEEMIYPGMGDVCYKASHQIEYFNIKPLCRALIVVMENPIKQRIAHFEQQLVRLVRTEWTAGLSQPINFQGLEVQEIINENEVVVLLPEAVRFIMDLDEKEEALQEKRDPTVLETWLGEPEIRISRLENAVKASEPLWTGGFLPKGPSTEWWELAKTLE